MCGDIKIGALALAAEAKTDAPPAAAALVRALEPSGGCAAMTGRATGAAGTAAAAGLWRPSSGTSAGTDAAARRWLRREDGSGDDRRDDRMPSANHILSVLCSCRDCSQVGSHAL
ncbi:hypothetical protein CHLRE_10g420226v5 [Chlamydomonas reinhardtii]|uniref:Uncharacterized protein n=1 Tax=Chlamydomonas reinhardtii TaxID=3055 RepID=A0A2K3D938_CHLRE|nr:uncharacterized protein CHLRE_10g420226v5 [Chlamydomonas reinhardtii]PNW77051.1 hypothetical protein CHLRE_10g420226v5 [Chlamydomonas reinhardtii]